MNAPANASLPLVSVIVPAYCAAQYIDRTLESVLAQTYRNIEVLIVDDGSTDRTEEIAATFASRDPRVRLLRQSNKGVAAARNFGISHAGGEFIAPIDADDLWAAETIEKLVLALVQAGPSCGVAYSWSFDVDENDATLGGFHAYRIEGDVYTTLLCHNFLGNASCTLIRARCLKDVGLYTLEFKEQGLQGCEDWELYLRLATKYQFIVVPEFLVCYRKSAQSMSHLCASMAASHALLLSYAERNAPVPKFARLLSTSSFYVHLAHQCSEANRHRESLSWLLKAVRSECVTPLMRIEVYLLLLKSLIGLCKKPNSSTFRNSARPLSGGRPNRELELRWRQAVGSALHHILQLFFGNRSKGNVSVGET